MRILILAVMPLVVTACDLTGPVCTTEVVSGLDVRVVDTNSRESIAHMPGMVIATGGEFADTVMLPDSYGGYASPLAQLAWERSGTYTVEVFMSGYAPWTREGIRVEGGECHVRKVSITAEVQPLT